MTAYLRNPLVLVWAFLALVTVASWWLGRDHGVAYRLDAVVTLGILSMAALKVHLVMAHFMEVRHAPVWLKRTAYGWNAALLCALALAYMSVDN